MLSDTISFDEGEVVLAKFFCDRFEVFYFCNNVSFNINNLS